MRHIPEEELHAYLDQALSRSQCVEVERHLTRCTRCRMAREEIAAVRDRTTDLLARLGPPLFVSPAFDQIRFASRHRQHRRWRAALALAAAALGVAILVQLLPSRGPVPPALIASSARVTVTPPPAPVATSPVQATSAGNPVRLAPAPAPAVEEGGVDEPPVLTGSGPAVSPEAAFEPAAPAATLQAVALEAPAQFADPSLPRLGEFANIEAQPVDFAPAPPGLWLTVASEDTRMATPAEAARIPGLTVVRVRVQPGGNGAEVVAVDQLLDDGGLVRTLSGSPERVHAALAGDGEFHRTDDSDRLTVTVSQGDRMVAVTGPAEVLGRLMATSPLRRRY